MTAAFEAWFTKYHDDACREYGGLDCTNPKGIAEEAWDAALAAQTDPLEKLTRIQEDLGLYDDMQPASSVVAPPVPEPTTACSECGKTSTADSMWALYCVQCINDNFVSQPASEPDPFAWATFDGEGGYDLRLYQDNEDYRDQYLNRNGLKYQSWVVPLYAQPAAKLAQPLTDEQITRWWSSENDLEDMLMCKLHHFTTVVRAVEAAHGITAPKEPKL